MKNFNLRFRILCFLVCVLTSQTDALAVSDSLSTKPMSTPAMVPTELTIMVNRLNEIKAMDKSQLTTTERKALRQEVKAIREEVKKADARGIYLSTGAIIIIILLLILIL